MMKQSWVAGMAVVGALLLPGLAAAQPKTVKMDGSSTVFPISEAVAEEFQAASRGKIRVTVGISGTGGGFKKFARGEVDIANASRPMLTEEIAAAKAGGIQYIELPLAFDAVTVILNPKNTWASSLSTEELKKIWEPSAQGKIDNWKQVRDSFPDAPLKLYGAGSDSGTFDYFTEAVVGKAKASRGDFTASEDDNVLVQGVSSDVNALGYLGYSYFAENTNKLKAAAISTGSGKGVPPSEKTVLDGTYTPLSRPVFIYISTKSLERPEVQEFVDFYLENVPELAREVNYVPLPADAYAKCKERVKSRQTGTAFGGHAEVGLTVNEILTRPLKN